MNIYFVKKYRLLFVILILFTIYNSFFLNKAFHIDDIFTIYVAREVNENLEANRNFFEQPSRIYYAANPLLLGYYYAPIIKFFGEKEIYLHIFYLPFSLLVIISMYFLSKRFTRNGLLPTIFLISTPAFIVMSHNIMLDIPVLGFFLASTALFIYGTDNEKNNCLILSGLLAACAGLIKYSGLLLIPILLIYSLLFSKKRSYLFLVIPIFVFMLWMLCILTMHKQYIFFYALSERLKLFLSNENLIMRTLFCLIFLTNSSFIPAFLVPYLLRNKTNFCLFLISLPIGLCPFLVRFFFEYSYFEKSIVALFLIFSFFLILMFLKISLMFLFNRAYNKNSLFLSLWFFIFLIFTIFTNFIAARFVLLLFPPLLLLVSNEIGYLFPCIKQKTKRMFSIFVFATIFLSTIIAIGDYHFAGIYRNISLRLKEIIPKESRMYFFGGEWGYYYYMTKGNYKPFLYLRAPTGPEYGELSNKYLPLNLDTDEAFCKETFFVIPAGTTLPVNVGGEDKFLFNELERLRYIKTLVHHISYYANIILHNRKFHAGFYSHDWGLLPFYLSLKKVPIETFEIYRLEHSN